MQPEKRRDEKFARWLQVRKDLVKLLAEAKATKRKISEETLSKIDPVFNPENINLNGDLLFRGRN